MSRTPAEALAELERLRDSGHLDGWCASRDVRVMTVFGSAARRSPSARDLDIAVLADGLDLVRFVDELVSLTGCESIDVLDLGRADAVAKERALVGAVGMYEAARGLLARLRTQAVMERMDTDWLRRLDLDLLSP